MAKIRYNYDDNSATGYHKKSSGKTYMVFFWIVLLFICAWGGYKIFFGAKEDKKIEPAGTVKIENTAKPERKNSAHAEKNNAGTVKKEAAPVIEKDLAAEAVDYPLGKVELDKVPQLKNAELNKAFAKAVEDTDYQSAKTLLLKEIAALKNKSSLYYRTLGKYLRALNTKIIFDGVPGGKNQTYIIKSGDSLNRIAINYNLPVSTIVKANKLKSTVIYPGQSLRVYKGDWRIEVSKMAKLLYVYDGKELFAIYDIGIGKEGRTPKGEFVLTDKIEHPAWYSPDGRIVPYGEKENVLGTHWLKIMPTGNTDSAYIGYGIHGTWDNSSITKSMSNGCIRMTNEEVAELFLYIPRKTPVIIY